MTTAIVSSAIANKPLNGGNAWAVLSWIFGLRKLGLEVYLVEQMRPDSCVDATGAPASFDDSANLAYFRRIAAEHGLSDRSALILGDGEQTWGLSLADLG